MFECSGHYVYTVFESNEVGCFLWSFFQALSSTISLMLTLSDFHNVECFSFYFFFKQKTAYEMRISDWSSDVCSSDLLRLDTAQRFYAAHIDATAAPGFTLQDMVERADVFVEQLAIHSMLAAGTPGVQGVAPKFLLTQDEEGRWFPDTALPDARARRHWIVKLPRGRHGTDFRILRHEAIYLQAAAASGLCTIATPMLRENMLFLPRFDRLVDGNGVTRVHQETLAALIGAPGFGRSASMFALTERLAAVATAPGVEVAEFLCRDVLNRALRNPDNHLRNTSVQQLPDGTVRLAPLYDLAPMYLDQELITRTCAWNGPGNEVLYDGNACRGHRRLDDAIKRQAAGVLKAFGEQQLPRLADRLRALEADADIVEACEPGIEHQMRALREIGHADQATPEP